jgi:hypothetical protein
MELAILAQNVKFQTLLAQNVSYKQTILPAWDQVVQLQLLVLQTKLRTLMDGVRHAFQDLHQMLHKHLA